MDTNIQNAGNVVTEFKEKNEGSQSWKDNSYLLYICMIYKADS